MTIHLNKLNSVDWYDSIPSRFFGNFLGGGWIGGQGARVEMETIGYASGISVGGLHDKQSHWLKKFILAAAIGRGGLRIGGSGGCRANDRAVGNAFRQCRGGAVTYFP